VPDLTINPPWQHAQRARPTNRYLKLLSFDRAESIGAAAGSRRRRDGGGERHVAVAAEPGRRRWWRWPYSTRTHGLHFHGIPARKARLHLRAHRGSSTGFGAPERGNGRSVSTADGALMRVSAAPISDEVDGCLNGEHTPPVQPFASREVAMAAGTKDRSPSVASHRADHTLFVAPAASSDSFVLEIRSDACSHRIILPLPGIRRGLQRAPLAIEGPVWRRFTCGLMHDWPHTRAYSPRSINHLFACSLLDFAQWRNDVHALI
jgi:hypothetical protein